MGGVPKSELVLGGRSLLRRVLEAVPQASPRVVVGDVVSRGFVVTAEDVPGAGPAYAAAAGLAHVPHQVPTVALLACDLPFLTASVMEALENAMTAEHDGALLVDHAGRRQWLCGVWRASRLHEALSQVEPGQSLRGVLGGLAVTEVAYVDCDLPPWFDCDTPAALAYARSLDSEFPQSAPAIGSVGEG